MTTSFTVIIRFHIKRQIYVNIYFTSPCEKFDTFIIGSMSVNSEIL